ncbi:MAG: hypothetical protein HOW97_32325 [Catenulispora sp.]|nr:hypothetical protein [Catenulispora sp.]
MCQRVTCKNCGKATYRGCGMHVEQVLSGVSKSERCDCAQSGGGSGGGLIARLLGGRKN